MRAISDEAHRVGMTVTGHVPDGMRALEAFEDGMVSGVNYFSLSEIGRASCRERV